MASEKVQERVERWLAKADSHPLAKRKADLALLLANDPGAWERYGQFYEGWTFEEVAEMLEAVTKLEFEKAALLRDQIDFLRTGKFDGEPKSRPYRGRKFAKRKHRYGKSKG